MVNAIKKEIIDDLTLLVAIFISFLKENKDRLITLYTAVREFLSTSLIIHDSFIKARWKARRLLRASKRRLVRICQLFLSKKVSENKTFKKLTADRFNRQAAVIAKQSLTRREDDHYLSEAEDFVKKIAYFDEYQMLRQMISLFKSVYDGRYLISEDLKRDMTVLFMLMSLHKCEPLDDSRALFLISYVYTKHHEEIMKYVTWFMKK